MAARTLDCLGVFIGIVLEGLQGVTLHKYDKVYISDHDVNYASTSYTSYPLRIRGPCFLWLQP